ncbi:MAG: tetratricopeptide repeat protein, partial [Candidatus Cybelea sp.]
MIGRVIGAAAIALLGTTSSALAADDSAAALFARGDFSTAAAAYQTYLRAHPGDREAEIDLGAIRLYENKLSAAEALLDPVATAGAQADRVARLLGEV